MYEANVDFKMRANQIHYITKSIKFTFHVYQNLWHAVKLVEANAKKTSMEKDFKNHQYWNGQHTLLMKYVEILSPFIQLKKTELELLQYKQTYDEINLLATKTNKKILYDNQLTQFEKKYELAYYKWYKNYQGIGLTRIQKCESICEKLHVILSRK